MLAGLSREIDARAIGLARILFFLFILFFYRTTINLDWSGVPGEFWHPISIFRWGIPPPGQALFSALTNTWYVASFCAAVGFFTPVTAVISMILTFYILTLISSFGFYHPDSALVLIFGGILALSKSGAAWSVDAQIGRLWARYLFEGQERILRWPVLLIKWVWTLMFFSAGLAKLKTSGLDWITGSTVESFISTANFCSEDRVPGLLSNLTMNFIGHHWAFQLGAAVTLAFELSTPAILFFTGWSRPFILLSFGFLALSNFVILADYHAAWIGIGLLTVFSIFEQNA